MNIPQAYEFQDMTFCPSCALTNTNIGLLMSAIRPQPSMDEAIAAMMLAQVERGIEICTPQATMNPQVDACENCDKPFVREEV